jgi:hypothetical protein
LIVKPVVVAAASILSLSPDELEVALERAERGRALFGDPVVFLSALSPTPAMSRSR